MTRLLHVADLHISEARRPEDTIRMLGEISVLAHEKQCQGVIISGDVFDRASTPEERLIFAEFVSDLRHGSITVAVVPGNHDARKDLDLFSYSGARVLRLGEAERIGAVCVAGLPWVDRAGFITGAKSADEATSNSRKTATELLDFLRAQSSKLRATGVEGVALLAHLQVGGSVTSTGQTLIGHGLEFSPAELSDLGFDYVALGHIHKHQAWGNVVYAGSPERHSFGEPETKGAVIVTLDNGACSWEFVPLPARDIKLLGATRWDSFVELTSADVHSGDLVRYRYRVTPQEMAGVDEEAIRRHLLALGAAEVTIEAQIITETRVRSEAIIQAKGNWERFMAYCESKSLAIPPDHEDALRGKVSELEGQ